MVKAQPHQTSYGFGEQVSLPYAEAVEQVKAALKQEGFGVLCEIDVRRTLKEKLGVDTRPYVILGACNPPLAHQALSVEPDLGLLLPCNVVVRRDEQGVVHVEFMDPEAVLKLVDNPGIATLAHEVRERLSRVMAAV